MTEPQSGSRLARLRRRLAEGEDAPDAFLLTNDENRRYLSGFTGSAGSLLITASAARLLTDFRYVEQGAAQAPEFQVVKVTGAPWPVVAEQARELGIRRLGFESEDVSVDAYDQLQDAIATSGATPGAAKVELVSLKGLVEGLRQVKSAAEVEAIRRAVEIGDRAFERVAAGLRPGVSEREVAWRLEVAMRETGAEGLSFPIIVAAGTNGAMPHHRPTDRPIKAGEPVVIDMGCKVDGYCSDMTRTISLGSPQGPFWLVYETVLRAQQACIAGLKADLTGKQGDALARDIIVKAGHGEHFGHGTGHGVGLAIHENPRLTPTPAGEATLPVGTVVTVEPGIYLPDWGGVRIEDMVVVGEARCQVLTTAHKAPIVEVA
jgi:Xaa-Pro aminopeptidase